MNIYKINYVLDPRAALKFKGDNAQALPDWLYENVKKNLECNYALKLETSFNVLSIIACSCCEITHEGMEELISRISEKAEVGNVTIEIKPLTEEEALGHNALSDSDREALRNILGGGMVAADIQKEPAPKKDAASKAPELREDDKKESVFENVENLIAADELKAWAREMKAIYDKNLGNDELKRSLMSMSYLVSVNRGGGSSTVFESIGDVVAEVAGKKSALLEELVAEPNPESEEYNIRKIVGKLDHLSKNSETLYVFAIWIDKFQNNKYVTEWVRLLRGMRDAKGKAVFIFALPYIEKMSVLDMHESIVDIMPNRVISVKPMTNEDYVKYFERCFKNRDMSIAEGVYDLVPRIIAEEKSDGRFYGLNTIEKICDEIVYTKLMNIAKSKEEDSNTIVVDDVSPLLCSDEDADKDALTGFQKLEAMISLDEVKSRIKEIVATVQMRKKMDSASVSSMHMMFAGAPGTGKTVVARILGEILRENKILSTGGFYEVSRKDLVGSYVGHTAPKTAEVCKLAYGGILFIDEAYLLDGGSENDFGKEAIGTLIAEMENKRGDLVVIFAGYEKELEKLFELNPGLRDRIPYRIHFSNYNREELRQIFYKMLPGRAAYGAEFDEAVKDFFDNLSEDVLGSPDFSNGRFVRNLVERVISKAALRMQMQGVDANDFDITAADFRVSVADGEFSKLNSVRKAPRIGFSS